METSPVKGKVGMKPAYSFPILREEKLEEKEHLYLMCVFLKKGT